MHNWNNYAGCDLHSVTADRVIVVLGSIFNRLTALIAQIKFWADQVDSHSEWMSQLVCHWLCSLLNEYLPLSFEAHISIWSSQALGQPHLTPEPVEALLRSSSAGTQVPSIVMQFVICKGNDGWGDSLDAVSCELTHADGGFIHLSPSKSKMAQYKEWSGMMEQIFKIKDLWDCSCITQVFF